MWTNTFLFRRYMPIGWRLVTSGSRTGGGGESAIGVFAVSLGVTVGYSVFGFLYEESSSSCFAGQWGRLQPRSPVELHRRPDM
jgi:hypothetical protein